MKRTTFGLTRKITLFRGPGYQKICRLRKSCKDVTKCEKSRAKNLKNYFRRNARKRTKSYMMN